MSAFLLIAFLGTPSPANADSLNDTSRHEAAIAYWTPQNLASARTLDYEFAPGSKQGTRIEKSHGLQATRTSNPVALASINNATGISWTDNGLIQAVTGKVFFSIGASRYVCSGTVVTDNVADRSIVLTAGHCIFDNASRAFVTNWVFIPDYDFAPTTNCASTRFGCWSAIALVGHSGFTSQRSFTTAATNYDWGFAVIGTGGLSGSAQLDATVGSVPLGIAGFTSAGNQSYAFGYPQAAPYNGNDFTYCSGSIIQDANSGNTTWGLSTCAMTGGSSGGPWVSGFVGADSPGALSSLNSYGYTGRIGMYGPKFNSNTSDTFNTALTAITNTSVVAPALLAQAPLTISNSVLTGTAGTAIALSASGGSGTFAPTFSVSGTNCSILNSNLNATRAATCVVTATNPANGNYSSVTSASKTFTFSLAQQAALTITNAVRTNRINTNVTIVTSGGSGNGALTFRVTGTRCSISRNVLTASRATTCTVTATKAANGIYASTSSNSVVFQFN